jgi:hypothetical protein
MILPEFTQSRARKSTLRIVCVLLGFAFCLIHGSLVMAVMLSREAHQMVSGLITVPIALYGDGETSVSGFKFDMTYDPSQFELVDVESGSVLLDADKDVIFVEHQQGHPRILVTGMNQNLIEDGVAVYLVFRPLTRATNPTSLNLESPLATDPLGYPVEITLDPAQLNTKEGPYLEKGSGVTGSSLSEVSENLVQGVGEPIKSEEFAPEDSGQQSGVGRHAVDSDIEFLGQEASHSTATTENGGTGMGGSIPAKVPQGPKANDRTGRTVRPVGAQEAEEILRQYRPRSTDVGAAAESVESTAKRTSARPSLEPGSQRTNLALLNPQHKEVGGSESPYYGEVLRDESVLLRRPLTGMDRILLWMLPITVFLLLCAFRALIFRGT